MIIGLTGSFGAGKGAVVDYLQSKGFRHYSARQFIFAEAKRQGLDPNMGREVTIPVGNALRAKHGPAYIIESLFAQARQDGGNVVIESLRAVAEVAFIKSHNGVVVGIDAPPEIRYGRIIKRGSETDHVTFEEWQQQEIRELNPDDPSKQDIFGALRESDVVIMNDGTIKDLHHKIDDFLFKFESPK